jgi:hypothetical protein
MRVLGINLAPISRINGIFNHQEGNNEVPYLSVFFVIIDQVIVIDILFADLNKFYNLQANTLR